jgi:nicotinamide mononucleotide transporter
MEASSFFELLLQNIYQTSLLEIIAVVFGLLSVWYSKKVNILVFPTGIISVLIYVYICFFAKLYADMGINGVYFVMSVYGWYNWSRKGQDRKVIPVRFAGKRLNLIGIAATAVSFVILSYILKNHTDSNVPYWDSFTTAIFIVGMFLMAMKRVENWIYWIIGDVVSIPLYFYKGLVFTSLQFAIFLIIAVMGYYAWKEKAVPSKP